MADCGRDARNNTAQTHSKTMSLNRNSPVKFQAIGSVDKLHLTTPGVVKKNDHVTAKVSAPINEPMADRRGRTPPAARSVAMQSSTTPRRFASPLKPKTDSHETKGLWLMYSAMP